MITQFTFCENIFIRHYSIIIYVYYSLYSTLFTKCKLVYIIQLTFFWRCIASHWQTCAVNASLINMGVKLKSVLFYPPTSLVVMSTSLASHLVIKDIFLQDVLQYSALKEQVNLAECLTEPQNKNSWDTWFWYHLCGWWPPDLRFKHWSILLSWHTCCAIKSPSTMFKLQTHIEQDCTVWIKI